MPSATVYHGSPDASFLAIADEGVFGGVFGASDERAAGSHGAHVYEIESPRHLSNYALNYEIEATWGIAVELCDGDEDRAEAIMTPGCECDSADPEDGWELQRLRGRLAARLGFTSVEMRDEHGAVTLCLPGCTVRPASK